VIAAAFPRHLSKENAVTRTPGPTFRVPRPPLSLLFTTLLLVQFWFRPATVVPTGIVGYEYRWYPSTNLIA